MNRWQRFGQWLSTHWADLIKNLTPFLTVLITFLSLRGLFGLKPEQIIVLILGLLGINFLVERFLSLKLIENNVLSISKTQMPSIEKAVETVALTNVAFQLGIVGITSRWTDFVDFKQPFGERLKQQIEQTSEAT